MQNNNQLNLKGVAVPPIADKFIFSPGMDYALQTGAWMLWAVNAYRDWGEANTTKKAIILAGGLSNAYATYKMLQK